MSNERWRVWGISLAIVGLIVAVYFPVYHAHFVWDDRIYLHDAAWLRSGSNWMQHAFGPFFDSSDYFRPLGVALFAAEAVLFDVAPGPAHLLSLAIHLANTLCVGALARKLVADDAASLRLSAAAMLLFGLHPLLVEPVVWISSQFELLVTFFSLVGLIFNLTVRNVIVRSLTVAACFFLAACTKESAIAFPVMLLVLDWMRPSESGNTKVGSRLLRFREQAPVYAAVAMAGILYLFLRHWGLGYLVHSAPHIAVLSWLRLQLICFTYLTYWRAMAWPMTGLGPLHVVPYEQFAATTLASVAIDAAAIATFALGAQQLWKRRPLGGLIMGVTAALLPVLHVLPVEFDDSYYHDRYAMTAIAIACAFLPATIATLVSRHRHALLAATSIGVLWLFLAAVNIRVTQPLWSDEILLWQWALRENPHSVLAQDNLLSLYLHDGTLAKARPLADALAGAESKTCADCMLNLAAFAIVDRDAGRAAAALEGAKVAMLGQTPHDRQIVGVMVVTGDLKRLQGDLAGAEEAYRDAITLDPQNPTTLMSLAITLALEGKIDEARTSAGESLMLFAPDDRPRQQERFERILMDMQNAAVGVPSPTQ